jgi:hypothetical protein
VVGGWLQIHRPEVLPPYFAAIKKNPAPNYTESLFQSYSLVSKKEKRKEKKKKLIPLFCQE